jgi:hypothetical protein
MARSGLFCPQFRPQYRRLTAIPGDTGRTLLRPPHRCYDTRRHTPNTSERVGLGFLNRVSQVRFLSVPPARTLKRSGSEPQRSEPLSYTLAQWQQKRQQCDPHRKGSRVVAALPERTHLCARAVCRPDVARAGIAACFAPRDLCAAGVVHRQLEVVAVG